MAFTLYLQPFTLYLHCIRTVWRWCSSIQWGYMQMYTILYKGLQCPQILVSEGSPGTKPPVYTEGWLYVFWMNFLKTYLNLAVSDLSCGTFQDLALWCAPLLAVIPQALGRMGSVVIAFRLSCPEAYALLVPGPGIRPTSSALEG